MSDTPTTQRAAPFWQNIDPVWTLVVLIPVMAFALAPDVGEELLGFAVGALVGTLPFIAFAVLAVAYLKASGAEGVVARAFQGPETRMIFVAALVGGLAPFCSCEVIPFIAALLALGAPLSAVMAFWISSPLMDPAMFLITAGTLGVPFAVAKTAAAVGMGLLSGLAVMAFRRTAYFASPLKAQTQKSCCGCGPNPFDGTPKWAFWGDAARVSVFAETAKENGLFLLKWLSLAYLIEAMMVRWVPAEWVAGVLGGDGLSPILLGALVGAPAYLNGYAAVPLIDALLAQGMAPGAAMSFVLAGGASSIPAAMAVWALVRPRIFAVYIALAMVGAILAGLVWAVIA
ncbi:MAG: permease [Pseudomonadota bacterium]